MKAVAAMRNQFGGHAMQTDAPATSADSGGTPPTTSDTKSGAPEQTSATESAKSDDAAGES
jgi:6-phosphogluconate dehydrogenase